ncbi:hypothetical protein PoB_001483600 [Plakobranchus ocellatus]|uniref:Uncharacterized protein n=1 Tax=Plakobranchus ocellatus TaxID=259542 RepID=A0AAV3Z184_9GAST|nr:hypothetical protein PoB_001483600 [Plakobranchus ocellatus]
MPPVLALTKPGTRRYEMITHMQQSVRDKLYAFSGRTFRLSLSSRYMDFPFGLQSRCHAQDLNESSLLRKLKDKAIVASEAKYHLKCVTVFYRQIPKLAH